MIKLIISLFITTIHYVSILSKSILNGKNFAKVPDPGEIVQSDLKSLRKLSGQTNGLTIRLEEIFGENNGIFQAKRLQEPGWFEVVFNNANKEVN